MANVKITGLTELTTAADEDLLEIVDDPAGTPTSKKITRGNLIALTTAEDALSANVTMTNANQYYDGPSVSLAAGTWFIAGVVTVNNSFAGAWHATAKLWDGTTVESSGQYTADASGRVISIPLAGIVSPVGTTTYKISVASNQGGGLILAAASVNGAGNNASHIRAIKVG